MKKSKILAVTIVILLLAFLTKIFLFKSTEEKYYDLGINYFIKKDYQPSIFYLEKSYQLGENKALKGLASVYLEKEDYIQAEKYLFEYSKTISKTSEDYKYVLNDLGVCYFKQGNLDRAKQYWKLSADNGNKTAEENMKSLLP